MNVLCVFLGGGAGSVLRYLVGLWIGSATFPSEIKDAGATVEFDILSGCSHPEACSEAFTAKRLNWIFSQRKTRRAGK